ncbi:hypothetical protein BGZ57DRAFT_875146 [Hyaloscypha finlandica]|nr:hypothetical protein BGZ57DRAFT_875146 [Hyaloscypha finlandica]
MPIFTDHSSVIKADYTKSKLEVYQQIVDLSLKQKPNLEFLSVVQHIKLINTSFPSWVPQWDQTILRRRIYHNSLDRSYNTAQDTISSTAIDFETQVLKVSGILVGNITEREGTYFQRKFHYSEGLADTQNGDLLQYCISARNRGSQYITGENIVEVIAMVLRAGLGARQIPQTTSEHHIQTDFTALINLVLKDAGLHINVFPELIPYIHGGDSSYFEYEASAMGQRRKIFRTLKGYMGLGPDSLLPGDIAVVLFGGNVPYILRPQNGHYLFVGEAYIHGIMNGEVIRQWRDGVLKDEMFEIH